MSWYNKFHVSVIFLLSFLSISAAITVPNCRLKCGFTDIRMVELGCKALGFSGMMNVWISST